MSFGRHLPRQRPPRFPTLPEPRRLDPTPLNEARAQLQELREQMGPTERPATERVADAASHLESARDGLLTAMRGLDAAGTRALHVRAAELLSEIDDLRARVSEHA